MMQKTRKSEFPYLSGPDTYILKATLKLGLCSSEVLNGTSDDRRAVAEAWETAMNGSGLAPIDVHTPLRLWSLAGFPSLSVNNAIDMEMDK
jgi:hypothetical protein